MWQRLEPFCAEGSYFAHIFCLLKLKNRGVISQGETASMRYINKCLLVFFIIYNWNPYLLSLEYKRILLREVVKNIEDYRNKIIVLKLKLKHIDRIFDKLTFYDSKNNDIIFDISKVIKEDRFNRQILNLHEGMEYLVRFNVKGVGDFGSIIGELISFEPLVLLKLPGG